MTAAVLWDIDGTLLRAAGTGVRSFTAALLTVAGLPFPTTAIDMGGRTDPEIAGLILAAAGLDDPTMVPLLLAEVAAVYETFEAEFRALTTVKPGVADALARLGALRAVQTLVTGNIEPVARRKVVAAGLDGHLQLHLGGYGSDHIERAELVRIARRRVADSGATFGADRTWVIGDTHRDLLCAQASGVRCILVATGTQPYDELAALGADAVFHDLTDFDRLVEMIAA